MFNRWNENEKKKIPINIFNLLFFLLLFYVPIACIFLLFYYHYLLPINLKLYIKIQNTKPIKNTCVILLLICYRFVYHKTTITHIRDFYMLFFYEICVLLFWTLIQRFWTLFFCCWNIVYRIHVISHHNWYWLF